MSRQTIHYSVIVPAFRENGNIRPLVTRIFAALSRVDSPVPAEQVEIIIVDDNSRDGSVESVQELQREGYNVRIVVRTTERGLSSAVVRGFQEAIGDNMLCMDADLQVHLRLSYAKLSLQLILMYTNPIITSTHRNTCLPCSPRYPPPTHSFSAHGTAKA